MRRRHRKQIGRSGGVSGKPADDLQASFNPAFLSHGRASQAIDLSRFETGNFLPAGVYRMDVFVNGNWVARQDIRIANAELGSRACLQAEQLRGWGVAQDKLAAALASADECLPLEKLFPEAHVEVGAAELQVHLSIPHECILTFLYGLQLEHPLD